MPARIIVSAGFAAFIATQAPAMLATGHDAGPPPSIPAAFEMSREIPATAALTADQDGHFSGRFALNGQPVAGLIDTGATFVAMNEATARKIGLNIENVSYNYTASTAAGEVRAARATLQSVAIGGVSLSEVEALIVQGQEFPDLLIGMSFLTRMSSYAVSQGTMTVIQ